MVATPNYGWVMPDPTDFVTNLPADFELFGDAVDASVKALNPGTTAGDVDYYTSGTAKARLAIGTAGQVLTVNSGATAPQWSTPVAGGMTSIASGNLSGTSVSLTSIPGTSKDLQLVLRDFTRSAADNIQIRFNTLATGIFANRAFVDTSAANAGTTTQAIVGRYNGAADGLICITINDYANATTHKIGHSFSWGYDGSSSGDCDLRFFAWRNTGAITSIQIAYESGGSFTAGTYVLYGVS